MESANKKRGFTSQDPIHFSSSKPPKSPHSITPSKRRLLSHPIPAVTSRVGSTSLIDSNVFFKKTVDTVFTPPHVMIDPKVEEKRLKKMMSKRMWSRKNYLKKKQGLIDMEKEERSLKVDIEALIPEVWHTKRKRNELERENEVLRKMLEEKLVINQLAEKKTEELEAEIKWLKERKNKEAQEKLQELKNEMRMFEKKPEVVVVKKEVIEPETIMYKWI